MLMRVNVVPAPAAALATAADDTLAASPTGAEVTACVPSAVASAAPGRATPRRTRIHAQEVKHGSVKVMDADAVLHALAVAEHAVSRKILAFAPQPVGDPRAGLLQEIAPIRELLVTPAMVGHSDLITACGLSDNCITLSNAMTSTQPPATMTGEGTGPTR